MPETRRAAAGVRILRAAAVVVAMYAVCDDRSATANEWRVGVKQLTLRDPVAGGVMTGFVTYPTSAAPQRVTFGRFNIAAAPDAAPAAGQFPLVILSHGTGGLPDVYLWLFEGLTTKASSWRAWRTRETITMTARAALAMHCWWIARDTSRL